MAQQPSNADYGDQEINFSRVGATLISKINRTARNFGELIRKNLIFILILFLIGAGLGIYIDKSNKIYNHQIIVLPNFGSTEYMYSKISQLQSKIQEGDTLFIKSIGFQNPKQLLKIEVEPINDVYEFVNKNPTNFELIKLMAEDGDISKIIEDETTSKNYGRHNIIIRTKSRFNREKLVEPLLKFLNDNSYYHAIQKASLINVDIKMRANDSIIQQIDRVVSEYTNKGLSPGAKSSSFVYYNENTQLSEILKIKDELIKDQAGMRVGLINYENIIKDTSITLNILNKEGLNGKMKFIIPIVLAFAFVALRILVGIVMNSKK